MAASRYKYICIREDETVELIASQDIYKILEEYDKYDNSFTGITRQDLYSEWDKGYKLTTWND